VKTLGHNQEFIGTRNAPQDDNNRALRVGDEHARLVHDQGTREEQAQTGHLHSQLRGINEPVDQWSHPNSSKERDSQMHNTKCVRNNTNTEP